MKAELFVGNKEVLKLTFDMNKREEEDDLKIFINAKQVHYALDEFKEELRLKLKHGNEFKSADEALEWVRGEVYNILRGDE